jgi:hypothetical protein
LTVWSVIMDSARYMSPHRIGAFGQLYATLL